MEMDSNTVERSIRTLAPTRKNALRRLGPAIVRLARLEGLDAHGRAVERRLAAMGGFG